MTGFPLRRLPVTTPPVLYETTESYLARLSAINHLDRSHGDGLRSALELPEWRSISRNITVEQLATLTGYDTNRLASTLPEFRELDLNVYSHHPGPACPRCALRHPGGLIMRY